MSEPPPLLRLRLWIAGDAPNSLLASANLRAALTGREGRVELEVLDVFRAPEQALRDRVLLTPMLIRLAPGPERKVVGTLADPRLLAELLALDGAA